MKRVLYGAAGLALYRSQLHRLALRRRAVAAVFHRIDDALPGNPISVTRAQFSSYLDFFSRHFDVVPLSEILRRLADRAPLGRRLAITFDDGYADNYEVAAPELARRGMTACFFITSGFIGTDQVPFWDADRGIQSRWMTWDQVRELHRRGFEIGAHTASHPDLARLTPEEVGAEVEQGRREIEAAIGAPVSAFCYPFGGVRNITESGIQALRATGVDCCFACFGGTIRPGDDPFHLQRAPISPWHRSPYHYGLELLFDKTG